eukprot:CAMPEP_0180175830 /NCGR_PEP_ID=MMETSP0986-20121125/36939_1 /TAXON_ID=697907 /ORGANISM="non described non described, Strain CCMP2293" /LENGTH=114 /DNA_ID=CAMNT_0022128353 /DNA_START=102 /DNA_END=443 /DNA_ORIENTATION=-
MPRSVFGVNSSSSMWQSEQKRAMAVAVTTRPSRRPPPALPWAQDMKTRLRVLSSDESTGESSESLATGTGDRDSDLRPCDGPGPPESVLAGGAIPATLALLAAVALPFYLEFRS